MKNLILIAAIAACALSAHVASAQDKAAPATTMTADHQMSQMQASINEMQAQMAKIRATADPKERQTLMQAHMQTMQATMQMMHGMMASPMMTNGGQPGGMAMGGGKDMAGGDMMQRQQMMGERAKMMQSMMDQMQQHQQMMEAMPVK